MSLTKNFSLKEFEKSYEADRRNIDNRVPIHLLGNVYLLANGLQVLRNAMSDKFEEDISINVSSGFRCSELNKAVGGSKSSHHLLALAADINVKGFKPEEVVRFCVEHEIQFDHLINEYDKWVHISFHPDRLGKVYRADRGSNGKAVYTRLL